MRDFRRESGAAEVARRLLAYLLSGAVEPGSKIPSERQLAETLGVGRAVVREGLRALTLLGLTDVRQGDGTYLRRPGSDLLAQSIQWGLLLGDHQLADLVEARIGIESAVAELAATRRSEADLEELRVQLQEMNEAEPHDPARFIAADLAFHHRIAAAGANSAMSGVLRSIGTLLEAWMQRVAAENPEHNPFHEHEAILDALERADAEGARRAMREHLEASSHRLRPVTAMTTATTRRDDPRRVDG